VESASHRSRQRKRYRIDVRFQDSGEISVKNIDRPIRVWKWHPGATTPNTARSNAAKPEASVAAALPKA
jgi:adenylate cyclase